MKRLTLALMSAYISVASASPEALDDVRTTIGEWATAEKAISRESLQWQEERVLLEDLLTVADKRVAKLEAIIEEHEGFVSTADAKRLELLDQSERVAADVQQIESFLVKMERGLRELKPRLPEPLQEELEPVYQRLPLQADETTLGYIAVSVSSVAPELEDFYFAADFIMKFLPKIKEMQIPEKTSDSVTS